MGIHAYLNFNGNCRDAIDYYQEIFKTEPAIIMTYGDVPDNPDFPVPQEAKKRVMHSQLSIFGSIVMLADIYPGMPFVEGNTLNLAVVDPDEEQIRDAFCALSAEGTVEMELQKTQWSPLYGSVMDKFGFIWQFSCRK